MVLKGIMLRQGEAIGLFHYHAFVFQVGQVVEHRTHFVVFISIQDFLLIRQFS